MGNKTEKKPLSLRQQKWKRKREFLERQSCSLAQKRDIALHHFNLSGAEWVQMKRELGAEFED